MERQERKLSPSSNIGVDLTGRGQLDNNGPNRDAVESNRLGQWRSRLASSELHLRRWKVFGEAGRLIIYQRALRELVSNDL